MTNERKRSIMPTENELLLCEAAYEGNLDDVRRLIEREGVNPNCIGAHMPPLLHACNGRGEGRIDVVRYLMEEAHADATEAVHKITGWNALHLACRIGADLSMVRYLVEDVGLSVHQTDNDGNTALHSACRSNRKNGPLDIVKYLVETQNANIAARNVHVAFKSPFEGVVLYLLERIDSLDKRDLSLPWRGRRSWNVEKAAMEIRSMSWNVKAAVLRKYAMSGDDGVDREEALELNPIHTILNFPLLSTDAFLDCIQHFSSTAGRGSLLLDRQSRFPIHVALSNSRARTPEVLSALVDLEPRSALARDPSTGLYPYECVGLHQEYYGELDYDDVGWFNAIYQLFRPDPTLLLQTRGLVASVEEKASVTLRCKDEGNFPEERNHVERCENLHNYYNGKFKTGVSL